MLTLKSLQKFGEDTELPTGYEVKFEQTLFTEGVG